MLFGVTLRSPHPSARIRGIDTSAALAARGVRAVLTHEDVPGEKLIGSVLPDQPVLAIDRVRHHGEPIALVAADDPDAARAAAASIAVDYESKSRSSTRSPRSHRARRRSTPAATTCARSTSSTGTRARPGRSWSAAPTTSAPGPGVPRPGVRARACPTDRAGSTCDIATQYLHVDRDQVAAGLGLAPRIRSGSSWPGSAARSARARTSRCSCTRACSRSRPDVPVKMVYGREESFLGHVHRHPAHMEYEHVADRDGRLIAVRARLSSTAARTRRARRPSSPTRRRSAAGPYRGAQRADRGDGRVHEQPAERRDARLRRPAGRGRLRGADGSPRRCARDGSRGAAGPERAADGGELPTGQAVRGPVRCRRMLERPRALPLPERDPDPRSLPGGAFRADRRRRRAARCRLRARGSRTSRSRRATTTRRPRGCGSRGGRAPLGDGLHRRHGGRPGRARRAGADRAHGAGRRRRARCCRPTRGSRWRGRRPRRRLTWIVGGAVPAALPRRRRGARRRRLAGRGRRSWRGRARRPTATRGRTRWTPVTGQGDIHAGFAFVAHRAVVDVDIELGLARVVELACAQDVGLAVNPLALEGQLRAEAVQGLGLALTEELVTEAASCATSASAATASRR